MLGHWGSLVTDAVTDEQNNKENPFSEVGSFEVASGKVPVG